ncbi:hypothetical protein HHL17_14475 [Chitinophaga sp. G-6-1-13]|uniref:Uncharacterized protein n=1 Tax=Chitinophaga fulva TaxID=2728842 RepID=A0A848GP40_9BACT|nr:hypothetical protein [Chitinophaga fulva]NML38410.1 hypothetical protein [Chitinophaga fulva]
MKLVGFIKEIDFFPWAKPLEEYMMDINPSELIDQITVYLEKGKLVIGWMGYYIDLETKEHIAPHAYYTDGIWVWPSYYPYYIRKYSRFAIDKEFLKYLQDRKFEESVMDFNELELQKEFIEKIKSR